MHLKSLLCLTSLLLASCISSHSSVTISTVPPGAAIFVDGQDSGLSTPVVMGLEQDDHRIDLSLPGYRTATRYVVSGSGREAILWREMAIDPKLWRFPFWLTFRDVGHAAFVRFPLDSARIFVRLQPSGS